MNLVSGDRTKMQGHSAELRNHDFARSPQSLCNTLCLGSTSWLTGVMVCIVIIVNNREQTEW